MKLTTAFVAMTAAPTMAQHITDQELARLLGERRHPGAGGREDCHVRERQSSASPVMDREAPYRRGKGQALPRFGRGLWSIKNNKGRSLPHQEHYAPGLAGKPEYLDENARGNRSANASSCGTNTDWPRGLHSPDPRSHNGANPRGATCRNIRRLSQHASSRSARIFGFDSRPGQHGALLGGAGAKITRRAALSNVREEIKRGRERADRMSEPAQSTGRTLRPFHARHARILQGCEQNRRSPRPALLRNQRPQSGAGQRAHWIRPANSSAKRW